MRTSVYRVASIHCGGCEAAIRRALRSLPGVTGVEPDQATDRVRVGFDERVVGAEAIERRLAETGFRVRSAAPEGRGSPAARYGVLAVAVVVVALAGYLGYVLYPRFDLPAVEGAGLLGLAAAAGIASFFSPCSFPLLLGLLGRQAAARVRDGGRPGRPLVFGAALAGGAAVFLLLLGVVVGLGGEALFADVTFASTPGIVLRGTVGVVLILLGLVQLGRLPVSLRLIERLAAPLARRQARVRRERPVAGFGLLGFGYVLAGFG